MFSHLTWFKVQVFRQGSLYVAYSHTLDLATTGKSENEAMNVFANIVKVYERIVGKDKRNFLLLGSELLKLGWKQKNKRWFPPEAD